jgi:hypothetical protein
VGRLIAQILDFEKQLLIKNPAGSCGIDFDTRREHQLAHARRGYTLGIDPKPAVCAGCNQPMKKGRLAAAFPSGWGVVVNQAAK